MTGHSHTRPRSELAQAGYTIVEAALVLVVIGILLGTSLYPLGQRLRVERIEKAQSQLDMIRAAVLGYAYNNRTARAGIRLSTGLGTDGDIAVVPQGRPYLPCPDTDGDGIENRSPGNSASYQIQTYYENINQIGYGEDSTAEDLRVASRISPELLLTFQMTIDISRTNGNPLIPESSSPAPIFICTKNHGNVPWTTLGTPPMDPWGNRFTYRVDPIFANGVLGFGRESRSDIYDPRQPLTTTVSAGQTLTVYRKRVAVTVSGSTPDVNDLPGVVCLTLIDSTGCSSANNSDYVNVIAESRLTVFDTTQQATVARIYETGEFINGLSFIVLSHGANAAGAVPHQDGYNRVSGSNTQRLRCLDGAPSDYGDTGRAEEDENADSNFLCLTNYPTSTSFHRTHSFVDLPVFTSGNQRQFDDLLLYMSDIEVIQSMTQLGVGLDRVYVPPGP